MAGAGAVTLAVVLGAWVGPLDASWSSGPDGLSLISTDSEAKPLNSGRGWDTALSGDGRYVALGNGRVLTVKDIATGALTQVCDAYCKSPALSYDGRFIAFVSHHDNVAPGERPGKSDVFVKDLRTGTVRVVSGAPILRREGGAYLPSISADGRRVAFCTGSGVNPMQQAWLADESGAIRPIGERSSYGPRLSADGNTAVFHTYGHKPGEFSSPGVTRSIVVADLRTGNTTELDKLVGLPIPVNAYGINYAAPSADGSRLAFVLLSRHSGTDPERPGMFLSAPGSNPDLSGIYVADLRAGTVIHRVRNRAGGIAYGFGARLSADGEHLLFGSGDNDLVAHDVSLGSDVFTTDLRSGTTRRLSSPRYLAKELFDRPAAYAGPSEISADGATALFESGDPQRVPQGLPNGYYSGVYLARATAEP